MSTPSELRACPFCGAGEMAVSEQRLSPRMDGKEPALISVTIRHWCGRLPGVVGNHVEVRARDHESAVAAWNRRVGEGPKP